MQLLLRKTSVPVPAQSRLYTLGIDSSRHTLELSVRGLVKLYDRRTVVKGVDLNFASGRIVGLLGPNGAGKTTILHMTVGLEVPSAGSITLNGIDITRTPMYSRARAGIAYLPQEPSIFRKLTVEQNLLAVLESTNLTRQERLARAETVMARLEILFLARAPAYALSGGERRRVEIARALVLSPRLLLLDEPFAGIDPIAVGEIQTIILNLKEKGIGTVVCDHNVRETLRITDEAYIISEGSIFRHGSPDELASSSQVRKIYLGEDFVLDRARPAACSAVPAPEVRQGGSGAPDVRHRVAQGLAAALGD